MSLNKIVLASTSILAVAMACHSANAAYAKSVGDGDVPDWDNASEHQQASAVAGVQFRLDNPDAGPEASHESWLAAKAADGWVYGEEKNEKKKTHPCIKPFAELPPAQQFKDVLFSNIVASFAPEILARDQDVSSLQQELTEADAALTAAGIEESAAPIADSIAQLASLRDEAVVGLDTAVTANANLVEQLTAASAALADAKIAGYTTVAEGIATLHDHLGNEAKAAQNAQTQVETLTKQLAASNTAAGKKPAKPKGARQFKVSDGKDAVTAAEAAGTGDSKIAFADEDGSEIVDLTPLSFAPHDFDINESDGTALLKAAITFPQTGRACEVQSVVLLDEKGKVAAISGWRVPLSVGGGRSAEVPANTLRF